MINCFYNPTKKSKTKIIYIIKCIVKIVDTYVFVKNIYDNYAYCRKEIIIIKYILYKLIDAYKRRVPISGSVGDLSSLSMRDAVGQSLKN